MSTKIPEKINLDEIGKNAENFIRNNLSTVLLEGKISGDYPKDGKIQTHLIVKKTKENNELSVSKHYKWNHDPEGNDAYESKHFIVTIPEELIKKIAA